MADQQLITKLNELHTQVKGYTSTNEKKFAAMQNQLDALDLAAVGRMMGTPARSMKSLFKENESLARLLSDRKGRAILNFSGAEAAQILERKTTVTSSAVGASTTGVLQIGRLPDITPEARQELTVRDVLYARPTTFQILDFVKVNSPMVVASPVAEGNLKPENQVTFTTASERVKTIATFIPASRQVLDDFSELMGFLETSLGYYVDLEEEQQLLTGDATGENLHGLITQATAFSTGLLSAARGWNKIDIIGRGCQQITTAKELAPTFIVMHPADWWDIRLTKDGFGRYLLGDPQSGAYASMAFGSLTPLVGLFNLRVIATTSIAAGTFLLGSGSPIASEIRDRMELTIDISTEHADFFTRNLVAIRAEKRLALIVRRPASYLSGSFTTSPA